MLIGRGLVIGGRAAAATAACVATGVFSAFVAVGIWRHSPCSGGRMLIVSSAILVGIPAGMFCGWLGHDLFTPADAMTVRMLMAGGAIAEAILALLLDLIAQRMLFWIGAGA